MSLDVVIPVYKPAEEFTELIERLYSQTLKPDNIIIMNTEKTLFDEFVSRTGFAANRPGIKVFHVTKEEFDHGRTRHEGMLKSCADIVVMMTQDAVPYDNYLLENLTKNLSGNVAVAYARQLPGDAAGVLESVSREFNYTEKSLIKSYEDIDTLGIKAFFCSDVCAAYRRSLYETIGGFCMPTIFNEDMIFAYNALKKGYNVSYEASAQVIHSHRYTLKQQFQRNFDIGVSQADHPEVFSGVKSEAEGKKLVVAAFKKLWHEKRPFMFIPFCAQCFFKLLGYRFGKKYKSLSKKTVMRFTGSRQYFINRERENET